MAISKFFLFSIFSFFFIGSLSYGDSSYEALVNQYNHGAFMPDESAIKWGNTLKGVCFEKNTPDSPIKSELTFKLQSEPNLPSVRKLLFSSSSTLNLSPETTIPLKISSTEGWCTAQRFLQSDFGYVNGLCILQRQDAQGTAYYVGKAFQESAALVTDEVGNSYWKKDLKDFACEFVK